MNQASIFSIRTVDELNRSTRALVFLLVQTREPRWTGAAGCRRQKMKPPPASPDWWAELGGSVEGREESTDFLDHNPGQDTWALMCPPCVIWATHIAVVSVCVRARACFMPFGDDVWRRACAIVSCQAVMSPLERARSTVHSPLGLISVSAEGTCSHILIIPR